MERRVNSIAKNPCLALKSVFRHQIWMKKYRIENTIEAISKSSCMYRQNATRLASGITPHPLRR